MATFKDGITGRSLLIDDALVEAMYDDPDNAHFSARPIGETGFDIELFEAIPGLSEGEAQDVIVAHES
jgi:hypothetical protein